MVSQFCQTPRPNSDSNYNTNYTPREWKVCVRCSVHSTLITMPRSTWPTAFASNVPSKSV